MSAFTDMTARAAEVQLRTFGDAAQYRPGGVGEPIALAAVDVPEAQSVGEQGFLEIRHEIHVRQVDVSAPARGDSITVNGETFLVQKAEPMDAVCWRLIVRRGGA